MGRPPKKPEERHSNKVSVYLTGAELSLCESVAEERDQSVSEVIREEAMKNIRQ